MAGGGADKSWLLIMVLQIDSENSATGLGRVMPLYWLQKDRRDDSMQSSSS